MRAHFEKVRQRCSNRAQRGRVQKVSHARHKSARESEKMWSADVVARLFVSLFVPPLSISPSVWT